MVYSENLNSTEPASAVQTIAPAVSEPDPAISDLLKRPESVVLLIFFSLLLFWDTYLSVVEEEPPKVYLSSGQLARRLGTTRTAVRSMKRKDNFSTWTRSLDPERTAWIYQRGYYVPKAAEL